MSDIPSISVVIPTFNSSSALRRCIEGLLKQDYPAYEIIVVDDASTDDTTTIVASLPVRLIRLTTNRGPGAARNEAIRDSTSDLIVFVDSDCYIESPSFLGQHARAHCLRSAAVVGGGVQGIGRGLWARADSYCHWLTNIPNAEPADISFTTEATLGKLSCHLVTANMSVKRTVFDKVGLFNEQFRTGEDVDFCERVVRASFTMRFQPDIVLRHQDRETMREFFHSYYRTGQDRVPIREKHPNRFIWLLPRGVLSSLFLCLPIALLFPFQPILAWWRYDKRVAFYYPLFALASLAMALGILRYHATRARTNAS